MELTKEQAEAYYNRLHRPVRELADEELDSVAGGGCGGSEAEDPSSDFDVTTLFI